jgi:hypothetical protein
MRYPVYKIFSSISCHSGLEPESSISFITLCLLHYILYYAPNCREIVPFISGYKILMFYNEDSGSESGMTD